MPVMEQVDLTDRSDSIDYEVAKRVFGFSDERIDEWPWGVPEFSTDRNCAAGIVTRFWLSSTHRESFDRHIKERMPKPYHDGIAELLMTCDPLLICEVAFIVAEECGPIELP